MSGIWHWNCQPGNPGWHIKGAVALYAFSTRLWCASESCAKLHTVSNVISDSSNHFSMNMFNTRLHQWCIVYFCKRFSVCNIRHFSCNLVWCVLPTIQEIWPRTNVVISEFEFYTKWWIIWFTFIIALYVVAQKLNTVADRKIKLPVYLTDYSVWDSRDWTWWSHFFKL